MKYFIGVIGILAGLTSAVNGWGTDFLISNSTGVTEVNVSPNAWYVAGSNYNYVHVVWCEKNGSNWIVQYRRSTNQGATWGSIQSLKTVANTQTLYGACVSAQGSLVYVAWVYNTSLQMKYSTDNGSTWSTELTVLVQSGYIYPCLSATSGNNIHLVYGIGNYPNRKVWYKRSTNNGNNWNTATELFTTSTDKVMPCLAAVNNDTVHVTCEKWPAGDIQILYQRHTISGWETPVRIDEFNNSDGGGLFPHIAYNGTQVFDAWWDYRTGSVQVYYDHNDNYGAPGGWNTDTRLSSGRNSSICFVKILGTDTPRFVWQSGGDPQTWITYKGSLSDPELQISDDNSRCEWPSIAATKSMTKNDGYIHVVWTRNSNPYNLPNEIRYDRQHIYVQPPPPSNSKKLDNSNGNGILKISSSNMILHGNCASGSPITVRFYDVTGKKVADFTKNPAATTYTMTYNPKSLPAGVYIVNIWQDAKLLDNEQVILVK